jgi:hypothetical protein
MIFVSLVIVAQIAQGLPSPAAAQSPGPLKEIIRVRSSTLCTTLRNNLFPAFKVLRVNDAMIGRGQAILAKTATDAAAYAANASPVDSSGGDPFQQEAEANEGSASATGGASAASEMDAYQLGILAQNLAKNIERIEALLDDPHLFPATPKSDDERALVLAQSRLEAVADRQRASLNVLSATAEINDANDLRSRRDVIPYEHCMSCAQTRPFTPISMPDSLAATRKLTEQTETDVAPAVDPIVDACK